MTTVLFECLVTEFDIMPKEENDEISFAINEKSMVINFMDTRKDSIAESILMQSEIEKRDAIRLAKFILFAYKISENE